MLLDQNSKLICLDYEGWKTSDQNAAQHND